MGRPFSHESEQRILGAIRQVLGQVRKVASKIGGVAGSVQSTIDTTCDRLAGLDRLPPLVQGTVVRSGIGSYDCEVRVGTNQTIACSTLAPILNDVYGVSQACMPVPGASVLVFVQSAGLAGHRVSRGVILGVLPDNGTGGISAKGEALTYKLGDTEHPEGGASQLTEQGPASVASDLEFPYTGEFQCGRPHDIIPGEYALLNHAGAGLVIGALSTEVRGSAAASVRCSALDDQVRITSGHFRHISSAGSDEIYNDNGFITVESAVSMYQPERLGVQQTGTNAFQWTPVNLQGTKEDDSGVHQQEGQTAKKRYYRYKGYLGDIVNVFVSNPDPAKAFETMDSESKDQGLFHKHVDASGRLTVRSASGILFERYDRIPIPKRRHYAWDPAGDKETHPVEKRGFTLPDKYPLSGGLILGDLAAWWNGLAYSRFRQFGKDFTVPDQKDLPCPAAQYDELGKATEEFSKYDLRHSYMGLTPDGGFVVRDAWGSEIVMADGRITLNAAADIEIRSGSSVIVLGGHDVVLKAHDSMDLSTTDKDVRIKAEGNLQVLSANRGVLIQSQAKSAGSADWVETGEKLESSGVIIKADNATVAMVGRKASVQGQEGAGISSFNDSGNPTGPVVLAGQQVIVAGAGSVNISANETSGIMLNQQSATVCAPNVLLAGGQSAGQQAGDRFLIGMPVEGVPSMYARLISSCEFNYRNYITDTGWLSPFGPENYDLFNFSFRTTEEYGTGTDSGVAGGVFSVYQPSWAAMAEAKRKPLQGVRTVAWEEKPDADGEFPWPGKDAMQAKSYVTYKERNVNKDGLEEPVSHEAQLTPQAFSSYHIRKRD